MYVYVFERTHIYKPHIYKPNNVVLYIKKKIQKRIALRDRCVQRRFYKVKDRVLFQILSHIFGKQFFFEKKKNSKIIFLRCQSIQTRPYKTRHRMLLQIPTLIFIHIHICPK